MPKDFQKLPAFDHQLTIRYPPPKPTLTESIINPDAPLALRLSGQLMLGVVRIYSRKVNYLFQDCSEAMVKIKSAFTKADAVDLPEGQETAPLGLITLPENYDDLDVFFDPVLAASHGHTVGDEGYMQMQTSDANATAAKVGATHATAAKEDITLDDDEYDEWDNNFAYDERIDGDIEGEDAGFGSDDENDFGYNPSVYKTPDANPDAAVTDPNARAEPALEDYDADVNALDADAAERPPIDDDADRIHADDDDIAPMPLEDDLEDQDGVRGTLPAEQFKTPGPAAKDAEGAEGAEGAAEGGAEGKDGPGTPPASEPTSTPGITVEWGKAHQRNAAGDVEGKAKRAAGPRRKAKTKPIIDEVTMLTNEQIKAQLADTSDIVKPRGPDVVYKMADPAYDDDVPFGAPEYEDENGDAVMYWREGYGGRRSRPPPTDPNEVHGIFWGVEYRRDPLFGDGRVSEKLWNIRRKCVEELWRKAGEKWGAGYAAFQLDKRGRGMSKVQWDEMSKVPDRHRFKPGANPPKPRDVDDDYDIPPPMDPMDDDDMMNDGFGGGGGSEFGAGGGLDDDGPPPSAGRPSEGGLASEPPTPANAPRESTDWSTHTKRMLARLRPKLLEKPKGRGKNRTGPVVKMSEITKIRGEDNEEKACSRAEAARLFYQVLVLKTHGFVDVAQPESYGDIDVTAGSKIREDLE